MFSFIFNLLFSPMAVRLCLVTRLGFSSIASVASDQITLLQDVCGQNFFCPPLSRLWCFLGFGSVYLSVPFDRLRLYLLLRLVSRSLMQITQLFTPLNHASSTLNLITECQIFRKIGATVKDLKMAAHSNMTG